MTWTLANTAICSLAVLGGAVLGIIFSVFPAWAGIAMALCVIGLTASYSRPRIRTRWLAPWVATAASAIGVIVYLH